MKKKVPQAISRAVSESVRENECTPLSRVRSNIAYIKKNVQEWVGQLIKSPTLVSGKTLKGPLEDLMKWKTVSKDKDKKRKGSRQPTSTECIEVEVSRIDMLVYLLEILVIYVSANNAVSSPRMDSVLVTQLKGVKNNLSDKYYGLGKLFSKLQSNEKLEFEDIHGKVKQLCAKRLRVM